MAIGGGERLYPGDVSPIVELVDLADVVHSWFGPQVESAMAHVSYFQCWQSALWILIFSLWSAAPSSFKLESVVSPRHSFFTSWKTFIEA